MRFSRCHFSWVRGFHQLSLGKARPCRIVKQDAVFMSRPDCVETNLSWSLHLKCHPARFARTLEQGFLHGCLPWIKVVAGAEGPVNVEAKLFQRWQGLD